jgi:hypothetical protein
MIIKQKSFKERELSIVVEYTGALMKGFPYRIHIMDMLSGNEIYVPYFKEKKKAIQHFEEIIKKIEKGEFEFKYRKVREKIEFPDIPQISLEEYYEENLKYSESKKRELECKHQCRNDPAQDCRICIYGKCVGDRFYIPAA